MKANVVTTVDAFTVQVVNRGNWALLTETRFIVEPNGNLVIPINLRDGSDSSCISVTNASSVSDTEITVTNVSADTIVTIDDAKYRVTAKNDDPVSIASIVPEVQFVQKNAVASFTVTYNSGYTSDYVNAKYKDAEVEPSERDISISGTTLSVRALQNDTTVIVNAKTNSVGLANGITDWVVNKNRAYLVRYNGTITIPIGYIKDSDYTTITSTAGTISSSGITISNVTSDQDCYIYRNKGQAVYTTETGIIRSIDRIYSYAYPGNYAEFNFTLNSGYSASNLVLDNGELSGNTIYVPILNMMEPNHVRITDNLPKKAIGDLEHSEISHKIPIAPSYGYSYTEELYLANDISRSGRILQLGLYPMVSNGTRNIEIYMKHSSATSLDYNWVYMYSSDRVYSGQFNFIAGQWNFINLTSPFTYNGSDNMVLTINDITGNQSYDLKFMAHETNFYSCADEQNYWNRYYMSDYHSVSGSRARATIMLVFAS